MTKKSTLLFLFALAIFLGAFGAHGLKNLVSTEKVESYKTAVLYHFLMCAGLMVVRFSNSFGASHLSAFRLVFFGALLFSGSIYLLVFNSIFDFPINAILGPITPIGGVLMITGWIHLGWLYLKQGE